jgi:hypothetical protein
MSQIFKAVTAGNLPPSVPTSFITDIGTVIPSANVVEIHGGPGVVVLANPDGSNEMLVTVIDEAYTGTATTVDATPQVLNINIPVPNNSAMSFRVNLVAYDPTNNIGLAGELLAGIRNVSGTLTVISVPDRTVNADLALVGSTYTLTSSTTFAQVQVQGVLGHTLNWKGNIDIISVS